MIILTIGTLRHIFNFIVFIRLLWENIHNYLNEEDYDCQGTFLHLSSSLS